LAQIDKTNNSNENKHLVNEIKPINKIAFV